jgi:hypothetical protein
MEGPAACHTHPRNIDLDTDQAQSRELRHQNKGKQDVVRSARIIVGQIEEVVQNYVIVICDSLDVLTLPSFRNGSKS